AAPFVVMIHHAPPDEAPVDAGADRGDDATRLVARDDGPASPETERRGRVARGTIGVQITAAHARGLHLEDDFAWAGCRIGELLNLELAIAEKHNAAHGDLLEARPYHARPVRW